MGSVGSERFTPSSDYDMLLVLTNLSVPAKLVTTWIDGHFAEIYCTTVAALDRAITEPERWMTGSDEEALVRWPRDGQIRYDRSGLLQRGKDIAGALPAAVAADATMYGGWWGIGYNAAHLRRYARSSDPEGQAAAGVKLLFCLFQVVAHYFTMRRIPWRGEKAAMRYLAEYDPNYFVLLRCCLAESDLIRKVELYEELALRTAMPIGGLWSVTRIQRRLSLVGGLGRVTHGPTVNSNRWQG